MKCEIEVEISPSCNLRCESCNVQKRLHIPFRDKLIDDNLDYKIIEYVPSYCRLLFLGLGEPTLFKSQEKISNILEKREDLTGFIQTNGTNYLIDSLKQMILDGRLEIGLSYDLHHGLSYENLGIQKDLVSSMSICVYDKKSLLLEDFGGLRWKFPNLQTILVDPFIINDGKEFKNTFGDVEEVVLKIREDLPEINIYIQLFKEYLKSFNSIRKFYLDTTSNLIHLKDNWHYSPKDYLVNIEDQNSDDKIRILTNGKVLRDLSKIGYSWEELEGELVDIENWFG